MNPGKGPAGHVLMSGIAGACAIAVARTIEYLADDLSRRISLRAGAESGPGPMAERDGPHGSAGPAVVVLSNILPVYRVPDYVALSRIFPRLRILLSSRTSEENLAGSGSDLGTTSGLVIEYMRSLIFTQRQRHSRGFSRTATIFLPYDVLVRLLRIRPDVIISVEMGPRSAQACLYRLFSRRSKLIVHADVSERTEQGRGWLRYWMRKCILGLADAVIVNGEGGRRYVRRFGVASERIHTVPYSVQPDAYLSVDADRHPGEVLRLLYVGRFIPLKGLMPFLRTLAAWCESQPHRRVRWTLVGAGETSTELNAFRCPANLELRVRPAVDHAALPAVYGEADVFVLPTLADTWALVVQEAMLAGLPVLGSIHSQAAAELVSDGTTGWLFDPDHEDSVRNALDRCLSLDKPGLIAMGGAARARAATLTPDSVAEAFRRAIDSVMPGPTAGSETGQSDRGGGSRSGTVFASRNASRPDGRS